MSRQYESQSKPTECEHSSSTLLLDSACNVTSTVLATQNAQNAGFIHALSQNLTIIHLFCNFRNTYSAARRRNTCNLPCHSKNGIRSRVWELIVIICYANWYFYGINSPKMYYVESVKTENSLPCPNSKQVSSKAKTRLQTYFQLLVIFMA